VNGRNSDNAKILESLGWEPSIRLRDGLKKTYRWIEAQMAEETVEQGSELLEVLRG
jgi:nucleoside-diphosphate-sugar epimerase